MWKIYTPAHSIHSAAIPGVIQPNGHLEEIVFLCHVVHNNYLNACQ